MSEHNSTEAALRNVLRLIDELEELVENSTPLPLSSKKVVDEEKFFTQVQRLKLALPKIQEPGTVQTEAPTSAPNFDYKTASEALPSLSTLESATDLLQNALQSQLVQRELRAGWELWQVTALTGPPQGFVFIFRRPTSGKL